jgi:hypothetical protein
VGFWEACGVSANRPVVEIPSETDWGAIDGRDLDAQWAFKTFLGKSFDEAEAMFQNNALHYQEDLQSMPAVPFNYYAPALVKYVTSERAKGDSDGASSFLHLVCWLLKSNRQVMKPETERALVKAARYVAQRQEFYEAGIDIYGKFDDLHAEIEQLARQGA